MSEGRFATSISCMDGRIQIPLQEWIKENFKVDYVDTVTEPGVDKNIARDAVEPSVMAKVRISIHAHKSELIVFSGHHDCAANPVSSEEHMQFIRDGVQRISSWNLGTNVVGVWVDESWNVNTV